ncbi:MAG: tetrathionate reductase family octaheme c-type cytochrome [Gammaproteobacteria bacterium]|jgi:octaheme c-type cytochrome (tetrathionate reductase family)
MHGRFIVAGTPGFIFESSMYKLFSLFALITLIITGISCSGETETSDGTGRESALKQTGHTDHSSFFHKPFADGPSVTRACLECHKNSAKEVMQTAHWNWLGPEVMLPGHKKPMRIGKRNIINNFCIGIQSNWPACTTCHIGYGWEDENFNFNDETRVDCLVCHDNSGTYLKKPSGAGYPDESVDLLQAARSVGLPRRSNCGGCHFQGGGGNAIKHGDMDQTLIFPSERIDVHMGKFDMQCIDCHQTKQHRIRGRSMAVSVDRKNRVECTDCHESKPHNDIRLNKHTDRLACQSCHVPHMGADTGTKLSWDWSQAGQDLDITDEHIYLKIKGRFTWARKKRPEYYWYNETSSRYIVGDRIDPSVPTSINHPQGSRDDPAAKIWPFKVHRGKQPYDAVNQYFLIPNVHGDRGFWNQFDWSTALDLGSTITGLPYSGLFDFAPTEMYFPLSHMVASLDQTLQCRDCHGELGRINWKALGYQGDPLMHAVPQHDPVYLMDVDGVPVTQSGRALSISETCGMCHELDGEDFIHAHAYHNSVQDEQLPVERRLMMTDGPRIPVNDSAQMNCFLCHIAQPDHAGRLETIQSGEPEWSVTATLSSTGLVEKTDAGYLWNKQLVAEDGEAELQLLPVSETNCGACHGKVHNGSSPLQIQLGDNKEWTTEKTGQIFSPQRISLSALNLQNKDELNMPWDVHAERLVSCGDCHYSRGRPERLPGEAAVVRDDTATGARRRCESCHSLAGTHDWLPEKSRHFKAVTCESCHVPELQMAAQQSIDATVVRLDGTPQTSYRGVTGDIQDPATAYIRGYTPLLRVGTDVHGDNKVLPYNLVTRWFWQDQDSGEEIAPGFLACVWTSNGQYREEIMQAFDTNRDGQLDSHELRLDSDSKVDLIKSRLRANGVNDPEIRGEVRAYHIHHNVRHGDLVNRDCTRCHNKNDQEATAFTLSPYRPGEINPSLEADTTNIVLHGQFLTTDTGALQFVPANDVAQSYRALTNSNKTE